MSTNSRAIPLPSRRAEPGTPIPLDYGTTPGGTIYSSTPGGTARFFNNFFLPSPPVNNNNQKQNQTTISGRKCRAGTEDGPLRSLHLPGQTGSLQDPFCIRYFFNAKVQDHQDLSPDGSQSPISIVRGQGRLRNKLDMGSRSLVRWPTPARFSGERDGTYAQTPKSGASLDSLTPHDSYIQRTTSKHCREPTANQQWRNNLLSDNPSLSLHCFN